TLIRPLHVRSTVLLMRLLVALAAVAVAAGSPPQPRQLLYVGGGARVGDPWLLELLDLDGGTLRTIASSPPDQGLGSGVWSSGGTRIAFRGPRGLVVAGVGGAAHV